MPPALPTMCSIGKLDANAPGARLDPLRVLIGKNTFLAPQIILPDGCGSAGDAFLVRIPRALTNKLQKAKADEDKVTACVW